MVIEKGRERGNEFPVGDLRRGDVHRHPHCRVSRQTSPFADLLQRLIEHPPSEFGHHPGFLGDLEEPDRLDRPSGRVIPAQQRFSTGPLAGAEVRYRLKIQAELAAVEVKHVKSVLASLESTIAASLSKKGLGSFTMPGLFKVSVNHVPAKKARKGIDPFTKQERMFAAKPASVKVKVRPMKKLKDAASS